MLSRIGVLMILIASLTWSAPKASHIERDCHEHPQLIGSCFLVHGRLSIYNGAPSMRLWKIGTRRILGISEQRFAQPGYRKVPQEVEHAINQDVELFGDFTVCPFTHSKKGVMQLVCIDKVKNLSIRKRKQAGEE